MISPPAAARSGARGPGRHRVARTCDWLKPVKGGDSALMFQSAERDDADRVVDSWIDELLGDDLANAFEDEYEGSRDEFTRILTQIRSGIVRTLGRVSRANLPRMRRGGPPPVPAIVHGEVTTRVNEARGAGQLLQHSVQGWLRRGRATPPPQGNRGIATVNPVGSITWTVYGPDMRTIIYRQLIASAGTVPRRAAVGTDDGAAQIRENTTRQILAGIPTVGEDGQVGPAQVFRKHQSHESGPDLELLAFLPSPHAYSY
jgi:hypothetical protein